MLTLPLSSLLLLLLLLLRRRAGSAGREYEKVEGCGSSWWLKAKIVLGMCEKGDEGEEEEEEEEAGRGQVRSALAI